MREGISFRPAGPRIVRRNGLQNNGQHDAKGRISTATVRHILNLACMLSISACTRGDLMTQPATNGTFHVLSTPLDMIGRISRASRNESILNWAEVVTILRAPISVNKRDLQLPSQPSTRDERRGVVEVLYTSARRNSLNALSGRSGETAALTILAMPADLCVAWNRVDTIVQDYFDVVSAQPSFPPVKAWRLRASGDSHLTLALTPSTDNCIHSISLVIQAPR